MKRLVCTCVILVNVLAAPAFAGPWEVTGAFENFFPSDELWESYAPGGEIKAIYWMESGLGIAGAVGWTQWDVDKSTDVIRQTEVEGVTTRVTDTVQGDATFVPLGVSALVRFAPFGDSRLSAIVEAGVRYVFSDSSIEVTRTSTLASDPESPDIVRDDLDCDDGIVARIGAGVEWALTNAAEPMRLFLTGGYQFDLDKGDAESRLLGISDHLSLEAFYVEIGLAIPIP